MALLLQILIVLPVRMTVTMVLTVMNALLTITIVVPKDAETITIMMIGIDSAAIKEVEAEAISVEMAFAQDRRGRECQSLKATKLYPP